MKKFNIAINILQIICNLVVVILLYILVDGFNAGIYREWAWVLIVVFISLPFSLWANVYVYFGCLNKLKNKKENDMEIYKDLGFGIIQTTKEPFYKQGWVCPKCGAVMSPDQPYCLFCKPVDTRVEVTTTGIMPTINTENKSISKGELYEKI